MKHTRLTKLERLACGWTCPGCGLPPLRAGGLESAPELERLSKAERDELLRLVGLAETAPCPRCGRAGCEMGCLTDAQLDRALALLRVAVGPEDPLSGLCAIEDVDRDLS